MSRPRLFDIDPVLLQREVFVPSADGATFDIVTQQDAGPILVQNQRRRNAAPKHQFNEKSGLTKVATIPNTVMQDLRKQGILADPDRFKAWLNDPENRMFRTREGKV